MTNTYIQDQIAKVDVAEIVNKPIQSLKNIAGALAKAQLEMKNPALDKTNPFFHSKYASLAAVRDASIPILAKHGIATMQLLSNAPNGDIICTTTLLHTSGEFITSDLVLPAAKKDAQGLGSASTYARRYALQAIVGIVGEDDDDGNESAKKQTPAQETQSETVNPTGITLVTGISNITSKAGKKKDGKPYKVYTIYGEGDIKYSTFDENIATLAKIAKESGLKVSITTKGDKYNTILSLAIVEPDFNEPELTAVDDINSEPLPWESEKT